MKKLKYMGMSHEHHLLAGDDFGGRLATGIPQNVVFSRANNWIVDPSELGLSDEALDILTSTEDFLDVTEMPRIPLNRHQTTFLGLRDGDRVVAPGDPTEQEYEYAAAEGDGVQVELTDEQKAEEEAKRAAVEAERQRLDDEAAAADQAKVKSKVK